MGKWIELGMLGSAKDVENRQMEYAVNNISEYKMGSVENIIESKTFIKKIWILLMNFMIKNNFIIKA